MNGSTAKRLKKIVHGDFSPKDVNYTQNHDGSTRCMGRRATYQKLKRDSHIQSGGNKHLSKGKSRPRWLFPVKKDQ